jgi:hypothetical protein
MTSPQPAPQANATGLPPGVEAGGLGRRYVAQLFDSLVAVILGAGAYYGALAIGGTPGMVVLIAGGVLILAWAAFVCWGFAVKAAGRMRLMGLAAGWLTTAAHRLGALPASVPAVRPAGDRHRLADHGCHADHESAQAGLARPAGALGRDQETSTRPAEAEAGAVRAATGGDRHTTSAGPVRTLRAWPVSADLSANGPALSANGPALSARRPAAATADATSGRRGRLQARCGCAPRPVRTARAATSWWLWGPGR